ncbi:MAG: SH3 domain-containing protein [Bacteroidota bacterium]
MVTRIKLKLFIFLFFGFFLRMIGADFERIQKADSLFEAQKYTEAFAMYGEIIEKESFSSSMLLKMAFIQDASGDHAEALYYLDLYYRASADRQAVGKIEELANTHELRGYQYDDTDYFLALLAKYRVSIVLLLLAFSIVTLTYIYIKYRQGLRVFIPFIFQVFISSLLIIVLNISPSSKAIITVNQTLLRSGPSAGAEPIDVIEKGHKVTILNYSDVWAKILWNGSEVFVRNNRLKII